MTYIDMEELALRIGEACMSNRRPVGLTAREAMLDLAKIDAATADGFRRAALAAANYIADCVNAENPGQVEVKQVLHDGSGAKQ